jgi:Asp-tRNA(Asn)/Glu-tRNA(Gln) amidotransferase A subunit family amidase
MTDTRDDDKDTHGATAALARDPMSDTSRWGRVSRSRPLHALGLAEVASAIRRGEMTAEAYTGACLERIRQLEPSIKAWAWLDEKAALSAARLADQVRRTPRPLGDRSDELPAAERGWLPGVPIGVKDIVDVAGMPTGMGSPIFADHWPGQSADLVRRLYHSGAIALGKTVTTEFAFMAPSVTRNPWNPEHTPGGSSSGSAAAVASGMVPAAIGTQTNGSVIRPAAFCGVVGYKPGTGRIDTRGVLPFSPTLDQPGVFARSVTDAALVASWLTRQVGDISHHVVPFKQSPRLLAVRSPVWHRAEPAQQAQFQHDLDRLRAAGADIVERELPPAFDEAHRVHRTIMLYEARKAAGPVRHRWSERLSPQLRAAFDEGKSIDDDQYDAALIKRAALQNALTAVLGMDCAGILTPPAPGEAPHGLATTGDPVFNSLWTLVGNPLITIPTGRGPSGMPLGLQIVGRMGESNYFLSVAAWCEQHSPFAGLVGRDA